MQRLQIASIQYVAHFKNYDKEIVFSYLKIVYLNMVRAIKNDAKLYGGY